MLKKMKRNREIEKVMPAQSCSVRIVDLENVFEKG
jgi:hypothetical protein